MDYEEDVPAEQPSSPHEARLPPAHAHPFWPCGDQPSPCQGPQDPLRLIIPISATGIVEVERLQSHRDFVTVLKRRRKAGGKDIVVHYLVPDDHHDDDDRTVHRRLGLAVSKSVGHAVTRNTVKRRFRVLARAHEDLLPAHCDIVLHAKPSAATASFASLDQQIAKAFATVAHKVAEA